MKKLLAGVCLAFGLVAVLCASPSPAGGVSKRTVAQSSDLARRYFASVQARDIEAFIALFAESAVMIFPDGRQVSGLADIRAAELQVFGSSNPPTPTIAGMVAADKAVAVQVHVVLRDGTTLHMGNFFELNEQGKILRLSIYRQG